MLRNRLAVILVAFTAVFAPASAKAHAVLVASTPADGARLQTAPPSIVLEFSEPVRPIVIRLIGPGGPVAGADRAEAAGGRLRIAAPPGLPSGSYALSYRVTSIDGHPVAGSIVFGIGAAAATGARAEPPPGETLLAALAAVNRAVHYAALLASAGGAMFILLVLGPAHPLQSALRPGLSTITAIAAVALLLALGISGAQLTGLPAGALAASAPWRAGASTSLLNSIVCGLAGLAAIALGLRLGGRGGLVALAAGALLALASLALTGHAATAPPRWASTPAVLLHVFAAAFWLGSLWPLAVVLRHAPLADSERLVRRFSTIALPAVGALIAAGLALSIVQIGSLSAIDKTVYGMIWLVKMVLVILLLGLAAMNRENLTPRLADPAGEEGARALRRSIAFEMALMALVMGATSFLGQTPPPRALGMRDHSEHAAHGGHAGHGAPGRPALASAEASTGALRARLDLDPGRIGENGVRVTLTDAGGAPLAVRELRVAWSLPGAGIEPFERVLAAAGAGTYAGEVALPAVGLWTLEIAALVSDFDKVTFQATIAVDAAETR